MCMLYEYEDEVIAAQAKAHDYGELPGDILARRSREKYEPPLLTEITSLDDYASAIACRNEDRLTDWLAKRAKEKLMREVQLIEDLMLPCDEEDTLPGSFWVSGGVA